MTPSRDWEKPDRMIGVDEALERILSHVGPLEPVEVSTLDALGMVLAEDVLVEEDVPPFQNSAMDGYALRAIDTSGASRDNPRILDVVGTVAAGSKSTVVIKRGQAARIMTGAPIPTGADTVVRFEETDEPDRDPASRAGSIGILRELRVHENVRDGGEDFKRGEVALRRGARIRAGEIGVLAALNRRTVRVYRRPRVAILATGNEVVDLGDDLDPGQIRDANSYMIAAIVRRFGGEPQLLGVARDADDDLRQKLAQAEAPDILVTSGGVSLGDYDIVKDVLKSEGRIEIWQVRMKPGKPLAFGMFGQVPLLGLPGNPAAALVSFEQFGRPALLKMLGRSDWRIPEVEATLTERIDNRGRRRHFVRGIVGRSGSDLVVRSTGIDGSAMLSAVARSNCFIVIPEDCDVVEPGMRVRVQLFDQDGSPIC